MAFSKQLFYIEFSLYWYLFQRILFVMLIGIHNLGKQMMNLFKKRSTNMAKSSGQLATNFIGVQFVKVHSRCNRPMVLQGFANIFL